MEVLIFKQYSAEGSVNASGITVLRPRPEWKAPYQLAARDKADDSSSGVVIQGLRSPVITFVAGYIDNFKYRVNSTAKSTVCLYNTYSSIIYPNTLAVRVDFIEMTE